MMKAITLTLFATAILVGIFFIWLTKPYMDYQSLRVSNNPVEVEVEYLSMTGDPLCSKLYEHADNKVTDKAILPNVPEGVPDPHSISSLKEGDRITLRGYRYEWRATNLLTGNVVTKPLGMMDVIAWHNAADLSFKSPDENLTPEQFKRENYTDCR